MEHAESFRSADRAHRKRQKAEAVCPFVLPRKGAAAEKRETEKRRLGWN